MPVGAYTPNSSIASGVTTVFPYSFRILDATHLVIKFDGVQQMSGFTVSGVNASNGGNITFVSPPAAGVKVTIERLVPYVRQTDYQANGDLREDTLDADQDTQTMQVQQVADVIKRSLAFGVGSANSNVVVPDLVAAKFLQVNGTADGFNLVDLLATGALAVSAYIQTLLDDPDAATARATLGAAGLSGNNTWTGIQTYADNKFVIADDADATKKAVFQCSGIGAGQTRTINVPNADSLIPAATAAQNAVYAGPSTGGAGPPAFRALAVADLPIAASVVFASLSADVPFLVIDTWYDGPSLNLGTGVWMVTGTVTTTGDAGDATQFKLWDGTTVYAATANEGPSSTLGTGTTLSWIVTNPAGNVRISGRSRNGTTEKFVCNLTGLGNKDCSIVAARIG